MKQVLQGRALRAARIVALVVAVGMLPLVGGAVLLGNEERMRERHDLDRALAHAAITERTALEAYFARARAVSLITARQAGFRDFYRLPGSRRARILEGGEVMDEVNDTLAYLERLYPQSIGEACFIDRGGAENARVVRGERAHPSDLSPDESGNPFFRPSFALGPGRVYQSRPYVSPDTGEWVISNSTALPSRIAPSAAIVHFEVTIESFRRAADIGSPYAVSVVDAQTGRVVFDTNRPQRVNEPLGRGRDRRLLARLVGERGVRGLDGDRIAYIRLHRHRGNANDWYVVARAGAPSQAVAAGDFLRPQVAALAAVLVLLGLGLAVRWLRRAEEALTDPLTGLPNRRLFNERLRQALLLARREGAEVGVLLLDLDRFKEVNDTLGHHVGDALLKQAAERLRATLRASDTLARLGGDEFVVLLPAVGGAEGALRVADKLRAALASPLALDELSIEVEASVGVALFPEHGSTPELLLQRADVAMYVAKSTRAGQALYSPEEDRHTPERLALVGELRRALVRGELVVHYQPKVDLLSERPQGVEALVRWEHPTRGLLGPGEFVPIAEHTALIRPLTLYVLARSLDQCRRWQDDGIDLSLSVNISANNLLDSSLPADLADMLRRTGVAPEKLELELTESALMGNPARALAILQELSALGVQLSIDDFGIGYSSLAFLKQLPIDVLKIDRSFVMNMATSPVDAMIVRSTIELARNLDLGTVAEGVEDEQALEELRRLGCDLAQGFHLARPMPPEEIAGWVADPTPPPEAAERLQH